MGKKKSTNKKRKKNRCEEINYQNTANDLNNNNKESSQESDCEESFDNEKENLTEHNNNESQENLDNEKNQKNPQNDNQNNNNNEENTQNDNPNNNNFDFSNISADDLFSLHLLSLQYMANIINIISEGIFLDSTIQGFRLVLERYTGNNDADNNNADQNNANNAQNPQNDPDLLGLECTYGFFMSKLIFTYVAFARYEDLLRRKSEGTINYSLQPNEDINTGNILGILALCYTLKGAHGIAERNRNQPIFGI
ncbi:hypothetical protein [Clostridium butyricum]|uniref:hypothetical protein n=1 Tax=Clostridium butyricum TaxID=1492 RepID=UPI000903ABA8|nr:hypothetical protein [Clostridium butyricum]APF21952.1 hypothetical protein NPD4_2055 [Clostridium butyricum]